MVPEEGFVKCRTCGFTKEKGQLDKKKHLHEISRNTRTMLVIESEAENGKPTIMATTKPIGGLDNCVPPMRARYGSFDVRSAARRGENTTSC